MKTISLSSLGCTNSFRLITSTTSYICVTCHKNSRWVLKLCLNFSFRLIHISPESLPLPRWRRPTVSWTSVQSVTLRLKCRRSKWGTRTTQTTLSTTLSACRIILNCRRNRPIWFYRSILPRVRDCDFVTGFAPVFTCWNWLQRHGMWAVTSLALPWRVSAEAATVVT